MAISITPSPFGSVTVTLDGELGGVLSVGVLATSNSALNMDLGVPGPQGEQGEPGANGQGVASGGLINQVLVKLSNDDFDTGWATISSGGGTWGSITGTLSNQTDLQTALNAKLSLTGGSMTGDIIWPAVGTGNDSAIGTFGFGTENVTLGQTAYVEPNQIRIYDNDHLTGTSLNGEGITFNDSTVQTTAYDPAVLDSYLPLAGGIMSGAIRFDFVGTQNIAKGSFDSGRGGYNGISLNCAVDYELNWQAGYLKALNSGGFVVPVNFDSSIVLSDDVYASGVSKSISANAISGDSYTGYEIGSDNAESSQGSALKIKFGNIGEGYENQAILQQNGLTFKDGISGTIFTSYGAGGITFSDSSVQYTAFPPTGGLVTQYITGTGSLVSFPPLGDRYFTNSNSTLTCDSGNGKTMTVGTGLSYSRQQDITVSYNNANHMHGTVLTYDPATGVMTFDSNTHSGSGTYSSWEVNVGGVAGAVLPVGGTAGQVLSKINSTNFNTEWISLGSMATQPASAYLSTASAVANYQTISAMSAYLSTASAVENYLTISSAASTYQTQSGMSAYLSTASASANYIGTSAYATTAQAQAGTSTTTVVSPSTLLDAKFFAGYKPLSMVYTWTSSVAGVGAFTTVNGQLKIVSGPTTAIGSAIAYVFNYNSSRGQQSTSGADFTKRTTIGGRFIKTTITADGSTVFRFLLGKIIPSPTAGDLSVRGIGFRQVANGALELQVHNGTTLYNVTSSFTPTANQSYDVVIVADAGTATMFVNGSSVATSANAPTALLGANTGILEIETQNTSTLSGSAMNYVGSDMFVQTNL